MIIATQKRRQTFTVAVTAMQETMRRAIASNHGRKVPPDAAQIGAVNARGGAIRPPRMNCHCSP